MRNGTKSLACIKLKTRSSPRNAGSALDNNNDALLSETVRATAITAHPYHWDVIGWMSDSLSWRRDEVMAYNRTYYAPNNAVLVVAGDIDPDKTLALIKKYYEPIKASPPPPPVSTVEPPQLGTKTVVIRKEAQAPSFVAVWHGPAVRDPDFLALSILAKPLLAGESSWLYRRLVREEALDIDVGGGISETIDPQLFSIVVKPRPGADLDRIDQVWPMLPPRAGFITATRSAAMALGMYNITVNALAPALIEVGIIKNTLGPEMWEALRDDCASRYPMGRVGQPIDVANLALFLASDEASFITGQVIELSGGARL